MYYSLDDVMEQETAALNVFPNPAGESLTVEAVGMTHMVVFNMLGQQIYETECDGNTLNVNVSNWNEGVYVMKVQTTAGVLSHRVSIVH